MPAVTQPTGMQSDKGCVVTVGIRAQGDRCAIILPMVADTASGADKQICQDCCESMDAELPGFITPCMSESAYISFIQAVGMMDGFLPHRIDYGPTENPGEGAEGIEVSLVGGLLIFYSEPDDIPEGMRIHVGKNTIPGLADDQITSGVPASGLSTYLDALAQGLAEGIANTGSGAGKWYRVCSAPKIRTSPQPIIRTGKWLSRTYLGTQRRRQLPH